MSQKLIVESDGKAVKWFKCENTQCGSCHGKPVYEEDIEFLGNLSLFDPGLDEWLDSDSGLAA
jgi:hypothetical protein